MKAISPPRARHGAFAGLGYLLVQVLPFGVSLLLLLLLEQASGQPLPLGPIALVLLCVRQATIFVVTGWYHRSQAHGSVVFHPGLAVLLRIWGWLFTGVSTRTWVTVHRWHHAVGDSPLAPFSPTAGRYASGEPRPWWRVGRDTLITHRAVSLAPERWHRFSHGVPDDALERFVHADERRFFGLLGVRMLALLSLGAILCMVLLGLPPGLSLLATLSCLPAVAGSVAAGAVWVVNGLGHFAGYRSFETPDTSHNVVAWDLLGLGEALHNNHHARPGSARFARLPGEIDPGWWILCAMRRVGLVQWISP